MDDKSDTHIFGNLALAEPGNAPSQTSPSTRPRYLIVVSGGIPGAMIQIRTEGARVGRSSECQVRVPDLSVSRRHATLGVDPLGHAWLTDLNSTNGTFLNGKQVPPHLPTLLEDGDRLRFGNGLTAKFVTLDPCDEQFQRELFERSVRDALTGLYNRAYFLDQVAATADAATGRGLGLTVTLLDIDHFKRVNDTHGHDAGDMVLREVAHVLRECSRTEDLVARYGGEEFVLALPAASPGQAKFRAERIRVAIETRRMIFNGQPLRVTASLGLAFARPGRLKSAASLITAADRALYQAKHGGRNRVVLRTGPQPLRGPDSALLTPREADA
ncbi:MAG: diguanylate cyclase [Isosphaeraceae bacterium]